MNETTRATAERLADLVAMCGCFKCVDILEQALRAAQAAKLRELADKVNGKDSKSRLSLADVQGWLDAQADQIEQGEG